MKSFICSAFLFAMLTWCASAFGQDVMSVWVDTPVVIDGRPREWPSFFRFYLTGAKLQFDFYNDSANLYVCVKATDIEAQNRLMHSGLNIWLDATGHRKAKTGLNFPMKLDGGESPEGRQRRSRTGGDPSSSPSDRSRAARLREQVVFAQTAIKVTGMIGVKEPLVPLQNKYGMDVSFDWDSLNILVIEYRIPLSLVLQHPVSAVDMQHPIGVKLVVAAKESQASHSGGGGEGGGNQGGSGRGGGGGMGGSGRGGGGGHNSNSAPSDPDWASNQEQKTWVRLHLDTRHQTAP